MLYAPGWSVIPQILVKRERWPGGDWLQAQPLVQPGQAIVPDQPVMRLLRSTQYEQGNALSSSDVVHSGSLAPVITAQPAGTQTVPAGVHGQVVELTPRGGVLFEARAALVGGVIGAGRQVAGTLTIWGPEQSPHKQRAIPPGAILVVAGPVDLALLSQALRSEVGGIVASSISRADFEGFLRGDLIELLTSMNVEQAQAHLPPLTLLLTEGIGIFNMPEHVFTLLKRYQGSIALLSGVTSVPLGMLPELIISLAHQDTESWQPVQPVSSLVPGALVRIYGGEYGGRLGIIDYILHHEHVFPPGIHARGIRLYLEDGTPLVVPFSQVKRVG